MSVTLVPGCPLYVDDLALNKWAPKMTLWSRWSLRTWLCTISTSSYLLLKVLRNLCKFLLVARSKAPDATILLQCAWNNDVRGTMSYPGRLQWANNAEQSIWWRTNQLFIILQYDAILHYYTYCINNNTNDMTITFLADKVIGVPQPIPSRTCFAQKTSRSLGPIRRRL